MSKTYVDQYRTLAERMRVTRPEVVRCLEAAASRLPRTTAIGVEVTYRGAEVVRVDAIAGFRGREFELAALGAWAIASMSPAEGSATERACARDAQAIAALAQVVAGELSSEESRYRQLWLESDGQEPFEYAPAIVCEHFTERGLGGLELPFGQLLAEQAPRVTSQMLAVPHAGHASMIGWMPGRGDVSEGAGRLYWDQRALGAVDGSMTGAFDDWCVPEGLQRVALGARAAGLDCAVAINVTAAGWSFDGLEVAPTDRASQRAWELFDDWASDEIPASVYWGFPFVSVFGRWDEREGQATLPSHILGAAVSLQDGATSVAAARPSHIKLTMRGGTLGVKGYAGLEYATVSLAGG